MTSSPQQADLWQAHRLEDVDVIRAGILDIIEVGPNDDHVTSRKPTRWEKDQTYRVPGPDGMFDPTPRAQSRRTGRSDPVGRAATAFERAAQDAVTRLSAVVSALAPLAPDLTPPDELETRVTLSGRVVVDADWHMCKLHVPEVCGWLETLVSEVADRWREGWAGDVTLLERAGRVKAELEGLRRWVAPDRPEQRWCACGCGEPAPPKGEGATREACRQRRSRERKTA